MVGHFSPDAAPGFLTAAVAAVNAPQIEKEVVTVGEQIHLKGMNFTASDKAFEGPSGNGIRKGRRDKND